ncbi:MAG: hypothetical protein WC508_02340 [Patescibacteria group bacterium]
MTRIKKAILVLVSIGLLAVIGYLVYDNFIANPKIISTNISGKRIQVINITTIQPNFSDDFLLKSPYTNLQSHSQPIMIDNLGRANPFQ